LTEGWFQPQFELPGGELRVAMHFSPSGINDRLRNEAQGEDADMGTKIDWHYHRNG
jgi:hypothetical protein